MKKVIIAGGGIAGLTSAYYLLKQASEAGIAIDCTLIESEPRFGGKITTTQRDGFIIEGGPDSFLTQKPWALALARELGLSDRLLGTNDDKRKVYVLSNGRLVEMPDGLMLIVPTRFMPFVKSPLLSWRGKLRMGLDLVIPPRQDDADESLADFMRRRLGQEALDKLAEPLLAGIHVADPERLSLQATFPRFIDMERKYGSMIRGMLAARRGREKRKHPPAPGPQGEETSYHGHQPPPTMFMSLQGGLSELVSTLVDHLNQRCVMMHSRHVKQVIAHTNGVSRYDVELDNGDILQADVVVLATPAYVSANLVEGFSPELAAGLRQIRYVSTATVSLGFRKSELKHPLNGFGFVIPGGEHRRIAACTWTSTKFDHRAPDEHVLLRAFVGGSHDEHLAELGEASLVRLVRDELADIMGIIATPTLVEVFRWHKGNPQYDVGHLERVEALERMCSPGLFLAGSAYRGVGLPDCTLSGQRTAEAVLKYLMQTTPAQPTTVEAWT